ncbi:MAG: hypothetical protein ABR903_07035 [Thermodesulfovibrionales bacterium]|jgi:hypothetical protein
MMGHVWLTHIQKLLDIAYAFDALGEFFKDFCPCSMGDDFQQRDFIAK